MNELPPTTETHLWTLEGPMGIYNAAELKQQLQQLLEQTGDLDIALSSVDDLDTAGVQLLALARAECLRLGKRLQLRAPSDAVREVLSLYNLLDGFDIPCATENVTEDEVIHG